MSLVSSLHFKLARTSLGLTQEEVADQSSVSLPTIKKVESTKPNDPLKNNMSTITALMKFFEDNGVRFINDQDSIGVEVTRTAVKKRFK